MCLHHEKFMMSQKTHQLHFPTSTLGLPTSTLDILTSTVLMHMRDCVHAIGVGRGGGGGGAGALNIFLEGAQLPQYFRSDSC